MSMFREMAIAALAIGIGTFVSAAINRRAGFVVGKEEGIVIGRAQGRAEALQAQESERKLAYLRGKVLGLTQRVHEDGDDLAEAC
ncbi:hypothetical protein ACFWYW_19800 [Nonomuraea sp. NPDC059023]|uniref:hypothetical protein n=1 Tax=unclassified Nonomuraea TaxID=2593643 RepID=UPI0036BA036C